MNAVGPLAFGLVLGWITAPLARAMVAKREVEEPREGEGGRADADADAAAPAPAATADASSSSSSSSSSAAASKRQQHPSLEHARASAGTAKPRPCPPFANGNSNGNNNGNNNNGNNGNNGDNGNAEEQEQEPSAPPPPPPLDLSTPEAIAALFAGTGLHPLRPSRDGRPLVAFDLEATGLSVTRDRVVEIAAVKVWPDGRAEVKGPQRLNPGREAALRMPAAVVDIHGLTPAMLALEPRWEDVAGEWREFFRGCDLAGYNALRYDVPLLR